jgi:hypothetical protein
MKFQAWYTKLLLVDPSDSTKSTIYLGGQLATAVTKNGGANWTLITSLLPIPWSPSDNLPYVYADCHFATVGSIRATPTKMFGTDGGIFISKDAGTTWDFNKNEAIVSVLTQTVASSAKNPQSVVTGLQDNGTRARLGASDIFNQFARGIGEGVGWSQANDNFTLTSTSYSMTSYAGLQPNTHSTALSRFFFYDGYFFPPIVTPTAALDLSEMVFLTAVQSAILITYGGSRSWYYFARRGSRIPASFVFRENWNFMGLNTGPDDGIAIAGYQGRVAVSLDYVHYNIQTILCPAINCLPGFSGYISSPAWALGSVRVVRSLDIGVTWQAAGNGLPDGPVYSMAPDFRDASRGSMYAGTNLEVYVTHNGGANWSLFGAGLPTTPVTSLSMDPAGSLLCAALNGRGIWEVKP